jgi:hypothetical protein
LSDLSSGIIFAIANIDFEPHHTLGADALNSGKKFFGRTLPTTPRRAEEETMKRQIVKVSSMMIVMIAVALGTAMLSVKGQSIRGLKAQIPFDFVVGDKTLSAGEYTVNSVNDSGSALAIRSAEASNSAIRLSNSTGPNRNNTQSKLVFHRYGQTYFLAEVWRGGESSGRKLLESKQERAMLREMGTVAQNGYETVELVATVL